MHTAAHSNAPVYVRLEILPNQALTPQQTSAEDAWEVASVYTRSEARGRGYAQAVVSFVTAAILSAGKRATCSEASDNPAMQRVAGCVGFQRVT
jgi:predicted GNAT family acetyltransferase